MFTTSHRAKLITNWLLTSNLKKLSSRECDNYLESRDGQELVKEIIENLSLNHVNSFIQLPIASQHYACKSWWTNTDYSKPNPETTLGIALF